MVQVVKPLHAFHRAGTNEREFSGGVLQHAIEYVDSVDQLLAVDLFSTTAAPHSTDPWAVHSDGKTPESARRPVDNRFCCGVDHLRVCQQDPSTSQH